MLQRNIYVRRESNVLHKRPLFREINIMKAAGFCMRKRRRSKRDSLQKKSDSPRCSTKQRKEQECVDDCQGGVIRARLMEECWKTRKFRKNKTPPTQACRSKCLHPGTQNQHTAHLIGFWSCDLTGKTKIEILNVWHLFNFIVSRPVSLN